MNAYQQICQVAGPVVKFFQDDLYKHDRQSIEQNEGVPFIHAARECGTFLTFLTPASDPKWPPPGVEVEFLFSHADRHHMLGSITDCVRYYARDSVSDALHYFDGRTVRKVTPKEAVAIAESHCSSVRETWKSEEERERKNT